MFLLKKYIESRHHMKNVWPVLAQDAHLHTTNPLSIARHRLTKAAKSTRKVRETIHCHRQVQMDE